MELPHLLLNLVVIQMSARLFGEAAVRLGQSAVLGELLAGVLVGGSVLGWVDASPMLTLVGDLGVLLLLFKIGLESDAPALLEAGREAAAVAVIGVVVPFALGAGASLALGLTALQAVFVGATLTATSVAVSARVLDDLGRLQSRAGHIILGAAVLDDLFGLVILAVVMGLVETGSVSWTAAGTVAGTAAACLVGAVLAGARVAHWFDAATARLPHRSGAVVPAVLFALALSYAGTLVHLAPLIGAFAAGLILARTRQRTRLSADIAPAADIVVPVFFVLAGAAVDLRHLSPFDPQNRPLLWLTLALTGAAVFGKLAAGLGAGPRSQRWVVGAGMLPRGEVGLIFAGAGLAAAVISTAEYSAILTVVALTTLLAPPLLKRWAGGG